MKLNEYIPALEAKVHELEGKLPQSVNQTYMHNQIRMMKNLLINLEPMIDSEELVSENHQGQFLDAVMQSADFYLENLTESVDLIKESFMKSDNPILNAVICDTILEMTQE